MVTFWPYLRSTRRGEIGARVIVYRTWFGLQVFLWWRVFDVRYLRSGV